MEPRSRSFPDLASLAGVPFSPFLHGHSETLLQNIHKVSTFISAETNPADGVNFAVFIFITGLTVLEFLMLYLSCFILTETFKFGIELNKHCNNVFPSKIAS